MTTDSPNRPPDGFDKLLSALDADRDRAGAKYVEAHRRLGFYFQKRGCSVPNDLADETLNRVARKLASGGDTGIIDHYWYGVARLVLKEHWSHRKEIPDLDELPLAREPSTDPRATERKEEEDRLAARKSQCMTKCMGSLPEYDRNLITQYTDTRDKDGLAALLGMNVKTLRVKVHRIRLKLHACLQACLKAISTGSNSPPRRSSDRVRAAQDSAASEI